MLKLQLHIQNQLVREIEQTIINEQCHWLSDKYEAPTRVVWAVEHKLLLTNSLLPVELINELGFLLQDYGRELIESINNQCPPLPLAAVISKFIFDKEKAKFRKLQTKLNPSKDIEEIKGYKLSDYLILGYQFYDALFFVYSHCYKSEIGYYWGLKVNELTEYPKFIEKSSDINFNRKKLSLKYRLKI
ncbi:hypothetical protein [Thalassotalea euphylliae]|uniref:Uncharacterized protein n=1 Tax=Thalassotalea euphylliae TaxID=1655234 RepID=A0A3E0UH09_9GAMM|nr:hypothetical protein [Thalassotalea euphylliae]REL35883.1 hypothetical protein DXX92_11360 [Thalassotalea euphylliae]